MRSVHTLRIAGAAGSGVLTAFLTRPHWTYF